VNRPPVVRIASALVAAGLVGASAALPLWSMTLRAPQYPKGLHLNAFGTGMTGDLRELNILNHYIGMPAIEIPAFEVAAFPVGIAMLAVLALVSPLHRYIQRIAVTAIALTPVAILADLQWRLYTFGHSLDPHAPIRLKPFTPLVLGTSTLGNFVTTSMVSSGFLCLVAAALALAVGARLSRQTNTRPARGEGAAAIAALLAGLLVGAPVHGADRAQNLQERIAAAPAGGTVVVSGGVRQGPIVIRGPLTVVGEHGAVIDGGGSGSVVTLEGEGVVFRGFVVRNSGRQVTEEAAGIKASGSGHHIENNDIHDVYFGVHIGDGAGYVVEGNRIAPGEQHGARPGHGISAWHVRDSRIASNRISAARDGVYLSFTESVSVEDNTITGCRYGMHSMYSQQARFLRNRASVNLLGAALMMSDRLELRGNRIEQHREGTAAYGLLLKDVGSLVAEDNEIVMNRIGVYAEGVPTRPGSEAVFERNVIAGNEVGLALQSNAALTLTRNRIADNLTDVRPLGRQLSPLLRWSREGRGNWWSQYRGYDANRDGVGDVPHQVEDAMDALLRRAPLTQAFLYTPAHLALEAAARMFPMYRPAPLLIDQYPLVGATR
jgi:nitrous oxidase accessory protein